MIVTVDCGIGSVDEAGAAPGAGPRTDRHRPSRAGPTLPEAAAIVHPPLPGAALSVRRAERRGRGPEAGLGPLPAASRAKKSAPQMRTSCCRPSGWPRWAPWPTSCRWSTRTASWSGTGWPACSSGPRLGIAALMQVTRRWTTKPTDSSEDIAFTLAPRLNAAGRLGQAPLGVELLVTDSAERAVALAAYLHRAQRAAAKAWNGASIWPPTNRPRSSSIRRRRGAGAGRSRLAPGRDRHRGRAPGREVPSAGRDAWCRWTRWA